VHAPRNTHHVSLRYPFYQLANSLGNSAPRFLLNLLQFITYAPARAFVAFEPGFVLRSIAGQVMVAVVLVVLITVVWQRAQRRLVVHGG